MIDTKHRYEELRSVFENALDMVVAMDTSGIITEWNRQAEATFGWKKDEALGRHMADTIIPHKFRDAHRNGLKNFLETGDGPILNRRLEIAGLRRDGSEFPIELTITPIKTGNELVFYAFLRDLTELKKNESERLRLLQEASARRELLEILVKNIPVGIVLVSQPELILEMANPIAKSILPFELEIGKSLFKHAPQNEKIDKLRADYQRTLHGENSYTEDVLIPARRLSDGSSFDERYFTSRRLQVHLPDGRVGVLAMGQNTTEQVKLRQVLEKKVEARTSDFEMFFNNSLDLLCIAGLDGYAKRVNSAFEKTLGYSNDELLARPFLEFIHPDDRPSMLAEMEKLATGQPTLNFENRCICKDGSYKWLASTAYPKLPEGLLFISARDMTEKKQAEKVKQQLMQEQIAREEAEKALQLRDEFISVAAHELNTPLSSLSLQIQLLNKFITEVDAPNAQKFKGLMYSSKEQLDRFSKLVEDLLDVSRASAGMLIIEKTELNLSDIIRQVCKTYEGNFLKSKCTLELQLEPSVIGLWDKTRIEQILVNLLSNAMKFGAGKPIEITAKTSGTVAVLAVRDHGVGISKEDQVRLFNRYERAVSLKSFGGLGLGLFITRQIVTAHGGTIQIESELGKGSTFIVELPLNV